MLGQKFLSYPYDLTPSVTRGLFICCIGTHVHGSKVTSMLGQGHHHVILHIILYSGTSLRLFNKPIVSKKKIHICEMVEYKNCLLVSPFSITWIALWCQVLFFDTDCFGTDFFCTTQTLMTDSFSLFHPQTNTGFFLLANIKFCLFISTKAHRYFNTCR